MTIKSGQLLELGAEALSIEPQELVDFLVTFVKAKGREAVYLNFTTVSSYGQASGSGRRANWRFALLLLDYFASDARTLKSYDSEAVGLFLAQCEELVSEASHLRSRYNQLGTAEQPGDGFAGYGGLYLIIRHDTGDDKTVLRAEVMALDMIKSAGRTATYVTKEVVYRGSWGGAKQTLSVTQHGYRSDYQPDVVTFNFSLAAAKLRNVGGLATGTATLEGWPVVKPVIGVQLTDAGETQRYRPLWNQPDLPLRALAASIQLSTTEVQYVVPVLTQLHAELVTGVISPRPVAQADAILHGLHETKSMILSALDRSVASL